jgi:hypothetical protein
MKSATAVLLVASGLASCASAGDENRDERPQDVSAKATGVGTLAWTYRATLTSPDRDDGFGTSVDLDGQVLVVGAPAGKGAAFV